MRTIAEFRGPYDRLRRRCRHDFAWAFGVIFGLGLMLSLFEKPLKARVGSLLNDVDLGDRLVNGVFGGGIAALIIGLMVACVIRLCRNPPKCPHCRKDLWIEADKVIASRTCPYCKVRILQEIEADASGDASPDLPQVADWRALVRRRRRRHLLRFLLAFVFMWAGLILLVAREDYIRALCGWCWAITGGNRDTALVLALFVGIGIPMLPVFLLMFLHSLRIRSDHRFHCVHCGQSLFEKSFIVIETGNCYHCGRSALRSAVQTSNADSAELLR